jgi:heme a synthase
MIWLHRYAKLVAASTLLLIGAGGMVTSTGSGLSVPDWPNTYGWFMFSFPMDKWVGGIFYEHSHRLIASTVGLLTVILAIWTWRAESRTWVRRLGVSALVAVVVQGLLGGLTVLLLLPAPVSIGHAGLAQLFFCITLTLATATSSWWTASHPALNDTLLRRLATWTTALVYGQILLGATMRHTAAGMAIPTFPLAFGHVIPPVWTTAIAIHFAHRAGAVLVVAAIAATTLHVLWHHRDRGELIRPAALMMLLVLSQATLGALVVLSALHPIVNTAHVVNGALVLGTSLVLTLRVRRLSAAYEPHGARDQQPAVTPASRLDSLGGLGGVRQ